MHVQLIENNQFAYVIETCNTPIVIGDSGGNTQQCNTSLLSERYANLICDNILVVQIPGIYAALLRSIYSKTSFPD